MKKSISFPLKGEKNAYMNKKKKKKEKANGYNSQNKNRENIFCFKNVDISRVPPPHTPIFVFWKSPSLSADLI